MERARHHGELVEKASAWLVVGNRSILGAVKRGDLPQAIPDDSDPGRTTIWFGRIFALEQDGSCHALWTFPGQFPEEFSPGIWARLQATLRASSAGGH